MDNKNENLAAVGRSRSRVIPPAIVAPERETPGKIAKTCKKPIQSASFQSNCSRLRSRFPTLSAIISRVAVRNNDNAVSLGFANVFSTVSLSNKPIIPAGIVARIKFHPKRACGVFVGDLFFKPKSMAFAKAIRSFQKYMITATKVATCTSTSKINASVAGICQPSKYGTITRCPELEIGKNSVKP